MHTALDTCGFARVDDLLASARPTGLFLYDLKLMDDTRHRQYTGVSNAVILENLRAFSPCTSRSASACRSSRA